MDAQQPDPLTPSEIDMRDYREFPLEFERVFDSDTWTLWTDRERVVGLRLWAKSWHQEPCASLPADDRLLAKLAGYGDAVREWLKVKGAVMSGWIMCSDGRWYHPVVAEKAIDKWRTKRKRQADNAADADRKRRKRAAVSGGQTANVHPDNSALEGKGREEETPSLRSGVRAPPEEFDLDAGEDHQPQSVITAWNAMAVSADLPCVQSLTDARRKLISARFPAVGGNVEGMRALFERVGASRKLRGEANGQGHAGWRASFDWVLTERNFVKIIEGNYDDREGTDKPQFRNGWAEILSDAERASEARAGGQSGPVIDG